ncbi:glycine cleavage system protein R [Thaumasiovibrio sp. DFM-14]|uniref:glycine cleavage system protein R n=1 Tax=Thaumasiovibrio sp. DFM-14 TaxID=3384792 RepID=UPI0039A23600
MNKQFTITIAGNDKAKQLNALAAITHQHGGKWIKSKISRLDEQIVGIIRIDVPEQSYDSLQNKLLTETECHVRVIDSAAITPEQSTPATLKIESRDRPGIIHDLTQALDDFGVQLHTMENHRICVPDAGQMVFFAELALDIPQSLDKEQLIRMIEEVEPDLKAELV